MTTDVIRPTLKQTTCVRLILLTTALGLSACSSNPSQVLNTGYKTARAQSSLEVPPDLINTTSSRIKREGKQSTADKVLPALEGLSIEGDGIHRFLKVEANADLAWAKMIDYVTKSNLPILTESKRDGILETDWIGDSSTETATETRMRAIMGNFIGRPPINDKYKLWIERLNDTETAIHVEHNRLTQHVIEPKNKFDNVEVRWQELPGSGIESLQMLRSMKAFFGGAHELIDDVAVRLITENAEQIILSQPYDLAWATVGDAIKLTRYKIADVKRSKQLYIVKQPKNSSGILSRFNFKAKLGIKVESISKDKTRVTVTTSRGKYLDRKDSLPALYALAGELRK